MTGEAELVVAFWLLAIVVAVWYERARPAEPPEDTERSERLGDGL